MRARALWLPALWAAGLFLAPLAAGAVDFESSPRVLRVGHWIEARGELVAPGRLQASRVKLERPGKTSQLFGTVERVSARRGRFELLGRTVATSSETAWIDVDPGTVDGVRVKVKGKWSSSGVLEAMEVSFRDPGRDRVIGRIESIRALPDAIEVRVLGVVVVMADPLVVEHDEEVATIELAGLDVDGSTEREVDEDDLFGEGVLLAEDLRLAAQLTLLSDAEGNYDLDDRLSRDRTRGDGSLRARLTWTPSRSLFAVAEVRSDVDRRRRAGREWVDEQTTELGEAFLYARNMFGRGLELQAGRQDFDDPREWLYDANLDGVRFIKEWKPARLELSVSTHLSDASRRNLDTTNWIAYLSNGSSKRHLAAYVIYRDLDRLDPERTTHFGLRAVGKFLSRHDSWLELSGLRGRIDDEPVSAFGFDLGTTWKPRRRCCAFTVGYAFGSGDDDRRDGTDHTFRQTGLQDNNDKFAGVTSFRYYGELLRPELGNLHIGTLGIGGRLARKMSLDLVLHEYRQVELAKEMVDSSIDDRPNGDDKRLGFEADLVLGWRGREHIDLELVGGYFAPGKGFDDRDDAWLAKAQLRFRF